MLMCLHPFQIILKLGGISHKGSWAGSTKASLALEKTVAVPALLSCQKLALPFPVCKLVCSQMNHLFFMFPSPLLPVKDLAQACLCAGRNEVLVFFFFFFDEVFWQYIILWIEHIVPIVSLGSEKLAQLGVHLAEVSQIEVSTMVLHSIVWCRHSLSQTPTGILVVWRRLFCKPIQKIKPLISLKQWNSSSSPEHRVP